jgi:hypothetical protein
MNGHTVTELQPPLLLSQPLLEQLKEIPAGVQC